jgi:MFS family permease
MLLWGIVTIGQGLVQNQAGLIAMRLLLGLFEAGFFPGCVYLISMSEASPKTGQPLLY